MEGMAGGGGGGGKQNTIPRNQMTKRNSWADDAVWRGEEGKRFSNTGLVGRDSRQSYSWKICSSHLVQPESAETEEINE